MDAIELIVGDEDYEWDPPVGASKIGGLPNLPADLDWPLCAGAPLLFLAQIGLAETAPFDRGRLLPPSGFLWFFMKNRMLDFEGEDASDQWRALYRDAPREELPPSRRRFDVEAQYVPRPASFGSLPEGRPGRGPTRKLLGYPDHVDPGMGEDWLLLLQLDRIWDNGIHDGPSGSLFFWISRRDLAKRRFDNVRLRFRDDDED
jgi:uncharacterized protein YwqG